MKAETTHTRGTKYIDIVPELPGIGLGHVLHAMANLCKNRYEPQESDWFSAKQIRDKLYTPVARAVESLDELSYYHYRSNGRPVTADFLSQFPKSKQKVHDPEWFWKPQVERIEQYLIPEMQVVLPNEKDETFPNQELTSIIWKICRDISDAEERAGVTNPMYWGQRWYGFSTREKEQHLREAGGILFDISDAKNGSEKKYRPTSLGHKFGMHPANWTIGPVMNYIILKPIRVQVDSAEKQ